jgi:hypothetical protein
MSFVQVALAMFGAGPIYIRLVAKFFRLQQQT